MTRKAVSLYILLLLLPLLIAYCATAPYTNRSQLMLVSEQQATQLGIAAAEQVMTEEPVSNDPKYVEPVQRIGKAIAAQTDDGTQWQFHVIDKDVANAFALPGGNVFVYTGIMPYAHTEDQLATVMGHEIAHVLAHHGAERMSLAMAAEAGGAITAAALGVSNPQTAGLIMQAFGIATNVGVILPYSRTQESEADEIGLALMSKAGFEPDAAVQFWENMMAGSGGQEPPPFLSTHPSNAERIQHIKELLPWAYQFYNPPK